MFTSRKTDPKNNNDFVQTYKKFDDTSGRCFGKGGG